jgi:hypothetical protein
MQRKLRYAPILVAVSGIALLVGAVGCTGDLDSQAGSDLGLPLKIDARPKLTDLGPVGASPLGGIASHHHGGEESMACCFDDGSCQDLPAHDCMAEGGMPQGMDSTCETTECDMGGSMMMMACCFEDETCQDLPAHDCMTEGGTPQGMDTACETSDCSAGGGHGGHGGHGGG